MPIKSLEDLYTLLYNHACYEQEELVLDSYDTIYNNFNLNTIDEIIDFLKKYLVISKTQENNFRDSYSTKYYGVSTTNNYYIDFSRAIDSLFDISTYEDDSMCDEFICLILALLYWDDILHNHSIKFNELKKSKEWTNENIEEILNYGIAEIPSEVKFKY